MIIVTVHSGLGQRFEINRLSAIKLFSIRERITTISPRDCNIDQRKTGLRVCATNNYLPPCKKNVLVFILFHFPFIASPSYTLSRSSRPHTASLFSDFIFIYFLPNTLLPVIFVFSRSKYQRSRFRSPFELHRLSPHYSSGPGLANFWDFFANLSLSCWKHRLLCIDVNEDFWFFQYFSIATSRYSKQKRPIIGTGWVAWMRDSFNDDYVDIIFEFYDMKIFDAVHIYTNNYFTRDVQVRRIQWKYSWYSNYVETMYVVSVIPLL